ncbi:acylphosphatase [Nocardiopsis mangrovi]|uniref:acylphosphatase n=1 Tax=Nocardiopsis mangrovi TaxID=1179818 RepID=A0ABV9DR65_9ACTN
MSGTAEETTGGDARLTAWVRGRVQGVGFRWWVRARALELGLTGTATNLADGRVEVVAEGPKDRCDELLALLRGGDPPGRVLGVVERWGKPRGSSSGFSER